MFCNGCGQPVQPGSAFCSHCGADVRLQTAPPPKPSSPQVVYVPQPSQNVYVNIGGGKPKSNSGAIGCLVLILICTSCCLWPQMRDGCTDTASTRYPTATLTPTQPTTATAAFDGDQDFFVPGDRVVYIIDTSASMLPRFGAARRKLKGAIGSLHPEAMFNVIAASDKVDAVFPTMAKADPASVEKATAEIENVMLPSGGDDAFAKAFGIAVAKKPDHIIFLTDGDFLLGGVLDIIRRSGIPLHVAVLRDSGTTDQDLAQAKLLADTSAGGRVLVIQADNPSP